MRQLLAVTRKELRSYFGSPMALIFVGAFLAVTLFSFFWVDTFFARGVANVRPLFRAMPLLMIFLVAALTMRQWSEEQDSGTLEILLTLPVSPVRLVLGKFMAVLALVAVALALTLFLPITVALLGNLDWGPVFGGYLAAILLAAAYAAIGLFLSSRTDNQIVALISTVLVCGVFYLVGSSGITDFVGESVAEVLRAIGSGSRFGSIERGVVDLRDLLYYLSLAGIFLALNVLSLESKRWSVGLRTRAMRLAETLTTVLVVLNLALLNVWAFPLSRLRLDLTQQREYTLSKATRDLLGNLQEPLLIRAYFSEKTHPLLAPLVPRIRDMLREYQIASRGRIQLEMVDPAQDAEKEAEANQTYGISPTPFQVSGRYESSIITSYFNILIRYGDQNAVLGYQDLVEVEARRDGTLDVRLRNLEYDLTSAVRKAVYGFQSVDAVLAALPEPAALTLFVTPDTLPESLLSVEATIEKVVTDMGSASGGKLRYSVVDPDAPGSPVSRDDLFNEWNLRPMLVSLLSDESYYFYMVLQVGDKTQVVYPSGDLSEASIRTTIETALKRSSTGFLQVVGLWTPPQESTEDEFGQAQQTLSSWQQLYQTLGQEYEVLSLDLTTGDIPADVGVLVVVAPQNLSDTERFAIDQYLMRGGSVIVAAGNYGITYDQFMGGLALLPLENGLQEVLAGYGIQVEPSLVLDPQNEPFPVIVSRMAGDQQVQELQALDYPFFADVRTDGIASDSPIVSTLSAVTMNWASPITVDEQKNAARTVVTLLRSTSGSWLQTDTNIQPNFELYPASGFPVGDTRQSYVLAVSVQGVFESYFKGKPSPLVQAGEADGTETTPPPQPVAATVEISPETARLVVFGSAEFLDDVVLEISSQLQTDRYLNNLKLVQNAVAWATEDLELLAIRARGTSTRLLFPLTEAQQSVWEAANYLVALLSLVVIGVYGAMRRRNERPIALLPPDAALPAVEEVET